MPLKGHLSKKIIHALAGLPTRKILKVKKYRLPEVNFFDENSLLVLSDSGGLIF
jgi:hypothetical protein